MTLRSLALNGLALDRSCNVGTGTNVEPAQSPDELAKQESAPILYDGYPVGWSLSKSVNYPGTGQNSKTLRS